MSTTSAMSPLTTYPGSKATAPIDSPAASASSSSPSYPASRSASSAQSVPISGLGTSPRPSSSTTTAASASSPPAPPDSSGINSAAAPTCSHRTAHRFSSYPRSDSNAVRTAAESARLVTRDRTVSRSICRSVFPEGVTVPPTLVHDAIPRCPMPRSAPVP
ncbi:Uncharacterised protein [Mycobacteroides abscessus subsp. abscessus]|nr:Uncharacterised protein [Mycobacteroides abscessus subsp. abscessus]